MKSRRRSAILRSGADLLCLWPQGGKLQVNFSSVDLFGARCGAASDLAATADDLEDICCKPSLLIHGKEV